LKKKTYIIQILIVCYCQNQDTDPRPVTIANKMISDTTERVRLLHRLMKMIWETEASENQISEEQIKSLIESCKIFKEENTQRVEQERIEQERVEQERVEQERVEQERVEQERVEQERVEQERVSVAFAELNYKTERSKDMIITGLTKLGDVIIPGNEYNIGTTNASRSIFQDGNRIVNFSDDVSGVFETPGGTLAAKIGAYYRPKLDHLRNGTLFCFLPIDTNKREGFQNLPVYTYFLTLFLVYNRIDLVVVDPRHGIADPSVRIINLSKVLDGLMTQNVKIKYPFEETGDGLEAVLYCRGDLTDKTLHKIQCATGLRRHNVMHVRLVAGKNPSDFFGAESCYKNFYKNVATVLHQFSLINTYVEGENKTSIKKMYIVLDEFSAYAAYLAVAAIAYGVELIVLQYRGGKYVKTPVPS